MSDAHAHSTVCSGCGVTLSSESAVCLSCAFAGALEEAAGVGSTEPLALHDIPRSDETIRLIGDYELLEVIAQGGMGVVYRARQCSLNRVVALKLLLGGVHAGADFKKRFRQEAEVAARLQHPNIVPIYEIGEHEGQLFFSMEFVAGDDLAKAHTKTPTSFDQIAENLKVLAEAIHYAHGQGVLHRDLKPSNILVGTDGRWRITDFGLARQIGGESDLTLSGATLGTPGYLPPEQVTVRRGSVGPVSDVYSLGGILYYLLTTRPPHTAATVAETLQLVLDEVPVSPRRFNQSIPRELEIICLKCLEKDTARRYASANALAEDIERFCKGESILGQPVSLAGRVWSWSRRKPVTAGLIGALVVASIVGGLGVWRANREQARRQETEDKRLFESVEKDFESATPGASSQGIARLARELRDHPENRVAAERLLNALTCRSFFVTTRFFPLPGIRLSTWSDDGQTALIAGSNDGEATAAILPAGTGKISRLSLGSSVIAIALGDQNRVAASLGSSAIQIWPKGINNNPVVLQQTGLPARQLIFAPFELLLALTEDSVRAWNSNTGELLYTTNPGEQLLQMSLHTATRQIAVADLSGNIHFVQLETGQRGDTITNAHARVIRAIKFNEDGSLLASGGADDCVRVWEVRSRTMRAEFKHEAAVYDVQFSPDGTKVASASRDGAARIWNFRNPDKPEWKLAHQGPVNSVGFSTDGRELITGSDDSTVRIWDIATGLPATEPRTFGQAVLSASFSPARNGILAVVENQGVFMLSRTAPQPPIEIATNRTALSRLIPKAEQAAYVHGHDSEITFLDISPDGSWVATASRDKSVVVWQRLNKLKTQTLRHNAEVNCVRFSGDGRRVVTSTAQREFCIWDVRSGVRLSDFVRCDRPVADVQFSPDDQYVVYREKSGWPVNSVAGDVPSWLPELAEGVVGYRFGRDGAVEPVAPEQLDTALERLQKARPDEAWIVHLKSYFGLGSPQVLP